MKRSSLAFLLVFSASGLTGCAPDLQTTPAQKVITAEFDPTATPPVVPLPNDLAKDAKTGLLNIPDAPGASPAQLEFNQYLRTLDGFPPSSPITASFSDAIDPASLTQTPSDKGGSVAFFDLTAMQPLTKGDYDLKLSDDKKTMTLVTHLPLNGMPSNQALKLGHTYMVIVFGGDDPQGVKGADGTRVVGSATTFFLRSSHPLLTRCPDNAANPTAPECLCPQTKGSFDSSCRAATGLSMAQAQLLEGPRQQFSALFDKLLPVSGPAMTGDAAKKRENVVLAFTFSIAHGPFAIFDPTTGRIPFPNDALVDQKTGKVNLPFDPNSGNAKLYMGLNTLDGFSTTADETVPIDEADDNANKAPTGAVPNQSVFLLNATSQSLQPTFTTQPELVNGGKDWDGLLTITPVRPLRPDKTQYVAVITSDVMDSKGRALKPSVLMAIVKLGSPLIDMAGHSTLPGTLTDAQATQLEGLRSAYAGLHLFDILSMPPFSIPKEKVAMVWTFKTQSMTETLRSLAGYPNAAKIPTDVTILDAEPTGGALGMDVGQIVFGTMKTHLALSNGGAPGAVIDPTGKDTTIPFLFIAPSSGQAKGVAIIQHGFTGWRGNIRFIAEAFAKAGWAVIGIDINFHGQRTACIKDADCAGGTCTPTGACSMKLAIRCSSDAQCLGGAKGSCDTKSGACTGQLAPQSSLCMTHIEGGVPVQECNPAASGNAFLYFPNPFSIRDNLRQHVLDLSQLERVITADGPGSLKAKLGALANPILVDNSRTAYLGQSLGGIEGTLFFAVNDKPLVGVLNVPGGKLVDLLVNSPTFSPLVGPLLQAFMVPADSAGYFQLLNIFRWITDPGDPINFGRYIQNEPLGDNKAKMVIVQEAGKDTVIPNANTEALVTEIGLPFGPDKKAAVDATPLMNPMGGPMRVSTFFKDAQHGFIFDPGPSPGSTISGQIQAVVWIDSNGMFITPSSP